MPNATVTVIQDGSPGSNEVQTVELVAASPVGGTFPAAKLTRGLGLWGRVRHLITGGLETNPQPPTGGTFTLTYSGQTTAAIAYDAVAATVETALESLSNIDNVAVTGDPGGPWTVEFQGSLAATNVAEITADGSNLNTGDAEVSTTTEGMSAQNEIQRLTIAANVVAGTFTLTFDGQTTTAIAYIATATQVQSALEALSNIDPGDVSVVLGSWVITFTGQYEYTDVPTLIVDDSGLIVGSTAGGAFKRNNPGCPCCIVCDFADVLDLSSDNWEAVQGSLPSERTGPGPDWALEDSDVLYLVAGDRYESDNEYQVITFSWSEVLCGETGNTCRILGAYLDEDNYTYLEIYHSYTPDGTIQATLKQKIDGAVSPIAGPVSRNANLLGEIATMSLDATTVEAVLDDSGDAAIEPLMLAGTRQTTGGRRAGLATGTLTGDIAFSRFVFEQCMCCECDAKRSSLYYVVHLTNPAKTLKMRFGGSVGGPKSCRWEDDEDGCKWHVWSATGTDVRIKHENSQSTLTITYGANVWKQTISAQFECREFDGMNVPHFSGPDSDRKCTITAAGLA